MIRNVDETFQNVKIWEYNFYDCSLSSRPVYDVISIKFI